MNSNCSYVARNLYVDNAILNQVKREYNSDCDRIGDNYVVKLIIIKNDKGYH